ncbi:MAG: hypothetical protein RLZZ126_1371 [Pseudomonadota bacterium]|jgi:uncharacterized protein (DUF1499 family)
MGKILYTLIGLVVLTLVGAQLGLLKGRQPSLGLRDGKLKPPSATPNSVSSQADLHSDHPQRDYARIDPLRYTGDSNAAMKKLATVLRGMDRMTIVTEQPDYVYAQQQTALMKYTDDVEFALDAQARVIHVRSSSRLGRKDYGVNRARVEAVRKRFASN